MRAGRAPAVFEIAKSRYNINHNQSTKCDNRCKNSK